MPSAHTCHRFPHKHAWFAPWAPGKLLLIAGLALLWSAPQTTAVSSWNPTLLVNTEAFQVIDDMDSSANLSIKFGNSLNKNLTYNRTDGRFVFDASLYIQGSLGVTGTASGDIIHAGTQLRSSGSLVVEGAASFQGALTFGDALGDTVTVNAAAWTFANDTNLALSGGVNGLSFDTSTLSIDATNDRVGIGTTAPETTLEVKGTASGDVLHAQSQLRSSGSLVVEGAASFQGALTFGDALGDTVTVNAAAWTFANDTNFALSGGVNGLSFDTSTLSIDATNDRVGIGTTAPETTLEVKGTASGDVLHAQSLLTSSGTLRVVSGSYFQSGAVISRAEDAEFLRMKDTTNNATVGLRTGTGDPNGGVTATKSSLFFASDTGKVWKNNNGATQWLELATGSGTLHMAKMRRDSAQGIAASTMTKITFDAEEFDVGGIADFATNDRFDIKQSGKYLINATWGGNAAAANTFTQAVIYKNGSAYTYGLHSQGPQGVAASAYVTDILELVAGDYIEFYVLNQVGFSTSTTVDIRPRMSVIQLQNTNLNMQNLYPARATMWHDESTSIAGGAHTLEMSTLQPYNRYTYQTSPVNGSAFTNGFLLREGTYTLAVLGVTANLYGKIDWYIDNVLVVSAQDWYTAANTFNVVKTASVTVTGNGYHVLKGVVNGKNASSSNYYINLTKMYLYPATDESYLAS